MQAQSNVNPLLMTFIVRYSEHCCYLVAAARTVEDTANVQED